MAIIRYRVDEEAKRIEYFNEHWYKIEGIDKPVPSVTKVIDDILAKGYDFNVWLMANGFNSEEVKQRAGDSGTRLHKAFELAIKGHEVSAVNALLGDAAFTRIEWQKFIDWQRWYESLNPVPLATEKIVYSPTWGVAGTADLVAFINGELWLLDWKSGNNIYDSADIQVAAYRKAYNEEAELLGEPLITRAGVVHVGAKNKLVSGMNAPGISVREVGEVEERIFDRLVEIWNWRNPDPKIPTYNFPITVKLSCGTLPMPEAEPLPPPGDNDAPPEQEQELASQN